MEMKCREYGHSLNKLDHSSRTNIFSLVDCLCTKSVDHKPQSKK
jgi:hypothetical protein